MEGNIIKTMLVVFISLQKNGALWRMAMKANRRDSTTVKQNCKTRTLCSLTLEDTVMHYTEPLDGALCNFAAAAAAKSLQSCPTLSDPIDSSPPGSPVHGILQARTLEWVAISFSHA